MIHRITFNFGVHQLHPVVIKSYQKILRSSKGVAAIGWRRLTFRHDKWNETTFHLEVRSAPNLLGMIVVPPSTRQHQKIPSLSKRPLLATGNDKFYILTCLSQLVDRIGLRSGPARLDHLQMKFIEDLDRLSKGVLVATWRTPTYRQNRGRRNNFCQCGPIGLKLNRCVASPALNTSICSLSVGVVKRQSPAPKSADNFSLRGSIGTKLAGYDCSLALSTPTSKKSPRAPSALWWRQEMTSSTFWPAYPNRLTALASNLVWRALRYWWRIVVKLMTYCQTGEPWRCGECWLFAVTQKVVVTPTHLLRLA